MLPSRVPSYTSGRQKRTAHAFSEIFKQRFLKIIRTPHFFAVLSSTFVHFGASKTHGCTHSQKYLAKVSKDNTHPALFCRPLEYHCTLRNAKNARLHAFSEIFRTKVSKDNAHPARFYRSFEYPCKMCSRRQRKLR